MLKPIVYALGILFTSILFAGCSSRYIITVWKNQHAFPGKYNKILVSGIVYNKDTSFRAAIENHFKESLEAMGYPAVSSLAEFGTAGLKDFGQDDTYIALCNKGIDAVMTVALIDRSIETVSEPKSAYTDPVKYYYERIWHYKEVHDKRITIPFDSSMKYSWELILFDLSTLQPHYILQTRTAEGNVRQSMQNEFWKSMIKRLRKDRFLKSRDPITNGPKAF